jgi:aspartate-semialdehyde dehydrogenase
VKVAVVGATGAVGETILRVLEERNVPMQTLAAFASRARSAAARFRDTTLDVHATSETGLAPFDVVFFASGEDASEKYVQALRERGAVIIDNSATFRMQPDVPLIVPEVNAETIKPEHRLFPVANCTAIVLCMALAPIRDVAGLRSVRVATYQAASGAGRAGLDELLAGERAAAQNAPEPPPKTFVAPLAHNVVPQVGALDDDGWSSEERKVADETRKMLCLPKLRVTATTVRVPVRTAHSEAVFIKTKKDTSVKALSRALAAAPGLVFHPRGIVTPREVEGTDLVHVARLRVEEGSKRHFTFWVVGDQLRKGAATNAVQILELLQSKGYVGA